MRSITLLLFLLVLATSSHGDDEPSSGALGMPGAIGTFEFKPADWIEGEKTWWMDSDGVDPGVAGCHVGTDEKGLPNGRMFDEACLPNGLLLAQWVIS